MKRNMGMADRLIRITLAFIIAILYFTDVVNGTAALILGILAAVFVLTSFISFCPLYVVLDINTCPKRK